MTNSELLLYQTEDGQTKIDVRLEDETVWLSQKQMVVLFQTTKQNVSLHIRNIFKEGELDENSVVMDYLTTHTIPSLSGTFSISTWLSLNPKMLKEPSSPSRSNTMTANLDKTNISALRILKFAY